MSITHIQENDYHREMNDTNDRMFYDEVSVNDDSVQSLQIEIFKIGILLGFSPSL